MKNSVISTWKMSFKGCGLARDVLAEGGSLSNAIKAAINDVENNPDYLSVGYGGLPNREGIVELDAAYMDGDNSHYGAIIGVRNIANPIDMAIHLSEKQLNCILNGHGAEQYAARHGFEFKNMLTARARKRWENEEEKSNDNGNLSAYNGHDTVCVIGRRENQIAVGVSTSGLYMKVAGRVGDSPIIGGGLYSDSAIGAASATGVGEDIVRGVLSYEVVKQMETGKTAQAACDDALKKYTARMAAKGVTLGAISLIAMGADGSFGATTNLPEFAFIHADQDTPPCIYIASGMDGVCRVEKAGQKRINAYAND